MKFHNGTFEALPTPKPHPTKQYQVKEEMAAYYGWTIGESGEGMWDQEGVKVGRARWQRELKLWLE